MATRTALWVAIVGLLLAVTGASGCSSSTSGGTATADSRVTTTTGPPFKITVAGDSISIGLGAALRGVSRPDDVVKVIGEEGSGLARPDTFDWPGRLTQLASEFPPQVLVLSLSSNDAQDLRDAKGAVVASFSNPAAWDAEYSRRLAASFDAFAASKTPIVWVGHVATAEERVAKSNRHVQQLARTVASTRPWVSVADLADLLGTGDSKAERCLMPDGLHVTSTCLDEAARALAPMVQR